MKELMHCVVFYGSIRHSNQAWKEWISLAKDIEAECKINFTHIGVSSEVSFRSKRILEIGKALQKVSKAIAENETIESFEFYSLPQDYRQAAFDYLAHMVMCSRPFPLVLLTLPKKQSNALIDKSISLVLNFFTISSGLVFEMSKEDCPFFFATKMNQPSSYESLKILREF